MKKVIRLTEKDLSRLVKRIIKEREDKMESKSSNYCKNLFHIMEYVFDDFMTFIKSSPEKQSRELYQTKPFDEQMYDVLQYKLGGGSL